MIYVFTHKLKLFFESFKILKSNKNYKYHSHTLVHNEVHNETPIKKKVNKNAYHWINQSISNSFF